MKTLAKWRKDRKSGCDDEYVMGVRRAITMFRYCWVVDEQTQSVVNINKYDEPKYTAFDIELLLDPKPNVEIALGVHRGDLHPEFLYNGSDVLDQRDPLRYEPTTQLREAVIADCHDESVLKRFHLDKFPPYDRAMTRNELMSYLVLPTQQVPNSGIFNANGKYDRKKALRVFLVCVCVCWLYVCLLGWMHGWLVGWVGGWMHG